MLTPIVFCADRNFGVYLSVAAQSLIENSSPEHEYLLIIFDCGIAAEDLAVLERQLAPHKNFSLTVKPVAEYLESQGARVKKPELMKSPAMLGRLMIPDLCAGCDKVIYADMDMVFNRDMAELMQVDLGEYYLAAVPDIDEEVKRFRRDPQQNERNVYINSGLMLINVKAWREHKLADKALQFLQSGDNWAFFDQDAINAVCKGHILILDAKWNCLLTSFGWYRRNIQELAALRLPYLDGILRSFAEACQADKKVIHWIGWSKPWMSLEVDSAEEWWRYARRTENYGRYLEDIIRNKARLLRGDKRVIWRIFGLPVMDVRTSSETRKYFIPCLGNLRLAKLANDRKTGRRDFYLFGLKLLSREITDKETEDR